MVERAQILSWGLGVGSQDGAAFYKRASSFLGMDVYGYLLAREGRLEDVENLGCRLFNISDQHAEPWVVSGYVYVLPFPSSFQQILWELVILPEQNIA